MQDTLPFFDELIDYDVEWTTAGGPTNQPAIVDGILKGQFYILGSVCWTFISLVFGPNTDGGELGWFFSLPFIQAAIGTEQFMSCHAVTNDGLGGIVRWGGDSIISPSGQGFDRVTHPYFPPNTSQSFLRQARNADGTGGVGTGIPEIPGTYPWTNGRTFEISGSYLATGF